MEFSEKLNYLFELTNAEGKALAHELNITPPQISKMRKGLRGLPKYEDAARCIAHFFAERCESDIQLNALSKATRIVQVSTIHDIDLLTEILLDWLSDDRDLDEYAAKRADDFLEQFSATHDKNYITDKRDPRTLVTPDNSTFFTFYGNEGKRKAVERFFAHLIQLKKTTVINILTDESIDWITEDPTFPPQLQAGLVRLTDQGCTFRRIASPLADIDQAFDSLNRWLPLYMAGKATSYYYKRLRDNFNRVTIIGSKDIGVLYSFSVGNTPSTDGVTFYTTDKDATNAVLEEFEHYICMCEPIMKTFTAQKSMDSLLNSMTSYEECQENCIQRSNTLSFITIPWDVITTQNCFKSSRDRNAFLNYFAARHKIFINNLKCCSFTDIIRLAPMEDIVESRVPISAACLLTGQSQYYSPKEYMLHLKSILYLLEHEKNYHVVLQRPTDPKSNIIYVKDGTRAILIKETPPFTLFEVSEKYLVNAFTEYLQRRIPTTSSTSVSRRLAVEEIRTLIQNITLYISTEE